MGEVEPGLLLGPLGHRVVDGRSIDAEPGGLVGVVPFPGLLLGAPTGVHGVVGISCLLVAKLGDEARTNALPSRQDESKARENDRSKERCQAVWPAAAGSASRPPGTSSHDAASKV